MGRLLRDAVAIGALTCLLLVTIEGVVRLLRLARGQPATTRIERFFGEVRPLLAGYRAPPSPSRRLAPVSQFWVRGVSSSGSRKLAEFLAPVVVRLLDQPAPMDPRG